MYYEIAIGILALLSAFFSGLETALVSSNRFILTNLKEKGSKRADLALEILDNLSKAIAVILVGNNIVNIAAVSFIIYLASKVFGLNENQLSLVVLVETVFFLVFCEVSPKVIAKAKSESYLMLMAYPLFILMKLFSPLTAGSSFISKSFKKIFRVSDSQRSLIRSRDEINYLFKMGQQEGIIEKEHQEYISEILSLKKITAYQIMTSTINIASIEKKESLKDLVNLIEKTKFSRIPVYDSRVDNIVGYVSYRDLIKDQEIREISDLTNKPFFVPSTKNIFDLFLEMQSRQIPLAFVVNENGAVIGMLSYEDIAEELVGEIESSDHLKDELISKISDKKYLLSGDLDIEFFQKYFQIEIKKEGFEKIAGFVTYQLEKIPEQGDFFKFKKVIFQVEKVTDRYVEKVVVILPRKLADEREE
jgi:putative hemolysin